MKTPFSFANWNIVIGFCVSWLTWVFVYDLLILPGHMSAADGFTITCIFTIVSYIRSYVLAVVFSKNIKKGG